MLALRAGTGEGADVDISVPAGQYLARRNASLVLGVTLGRRPGEHLSLSHPASLLEPEQHCLGVSPSQNFDFDFEAALEHNRIQEVQTY